MMKGFKPVTAVLFDLDGLVLDTEKVYEGCFKDICLKYGHELTPEVRVKLLGTTEMKCCEICVKELNLSCTPEQMYKEYNELSLKRLENTEFMPGAERLIKHLHDNNIPICIASGSHSTSVKVKTKPHQEIFELFHHVTTGCEVANGKPAPDVFLHAASRFEPKIDPKDCLVFEDSPNGVLAALAADMQVVMVPADFISEEVRAKATMSIKSLEDFKPKLFGLPAFN